MRTEIGDYVEHTWDEHFAVVVGIEMKRFNMGATYTTINSVGKIETYEQPNFIANYDMVKSTKHFWKDGEQADYDSLPAKGRRLYDQIRTRLYLDHTTAYHTARDAREVVV